MIEILQIILRYPLRSDQAFRIIQTVDKMMLLTKTLIWLHTGVAIFKVECLFVDCDSLLLLNVVVVHHHTYAWTQTHIEWMWSSFFWGEFLPQQYKVICTSFILFSLFFAAFNESALLLVKVDDLKYHFTYYLHYCSVHKQ